MLRLLFWSLRHRGWRQLVNVTTMALTAGVVMVFVAALLTLEAIKTAYGDKPYERIKVMPLVSTPGSPAVDGFPLSMEAMFKGIPGTQVVIKKKVLIGKDKTTRTGYIINGEEEPSINLDVHYFPVEPDVLEAWKKGGPTAAIFSEYVAASMGLKVGDTTELPTTDGPIQLKIVGLSKKPLVPSLVAAHFDYVIEFSKVKTTCAFQIFTKPQDTARVMAAINDQTKNSPVPAQAISSTQYTTAIAKAGSVLPTVLGFLGIFLVFTTALTLANTAAISIRERRTEIATLRVVGYHRGSVLMMVLGEILVVGLLGGVLAIVVTSYLLRDGIHLSGPLMPAARIDSTAILAGLVTSIVVPLLGAVPSAVVAVRMPLVKALRDTA